MTIDQAIETLGDALVGIEMVDDPDLPNAMRLGIEALKHVRSQNDPDHQRWRHPLPGETFEV